MRSMRLLLVLICLSFTRAAQDDITEKDRQYWMRLGRQDLRKARQQLNVGVAKNVMLFLGDGMGVSTITAARILKGQLAGRTGEEDSLSFDTFPHVGLVKTYNLDAQTPDSAGTATAFLSGVKTNIGVLAVDGNAIHGNCSSLPGTELDTMLDWARAEGKSVGIVTTARVTHATPGALYAKSPDRKWESDTDMIKRDVEGPCVDIASQLIDNNTDIRVILGGGRSKFLRKGDVDPETLKTSSKFRSDGRNLIKVWKKNQRRLNRRFRYVWNAAEFDAVDPSKTDYLLGLFESSHMQFEADRADDVGGEPSLTEMVDKAVQILSKNPNGFFLLVEAGRIDHGHHQGKAQKALLDAVEFSEAVQKATDLTRDKDTLTVVTADHSHVFTIGGYPSRGNPIFGLTDDRRGGYYIAEDGKPFTTLRYANGPGGWATAEGTPRPDPRDDEIEHINYLQQAGVPRSSETHGGEDVAVFARGPMSHLVHGVHEQSYVAHVMAYASCVGRYSDPGSCAQADVDEQN